MANRQIALYTSSKLRHADMLRGFAGTDGFYFTARWIWTADLHSHQTRPAAQWQQDNFADIARSEAVLVYVEHGEHLKGGLIEAGVAMAYGLPIFVIGAHEDYSKWQYHPLVHRCATLPGALGDVRALLGRADERIKV